MVSKLDPPLMPRNGRTLEVVKVARISTEKQDPRSLEDQQAMHEAYVADHYDGPVHYTVLATQGSGEHLDRQELTDLEELIESRTIDLVIVEDLSRICRRTRAMDFCELCIDNGARLIAINDRVDTSVDGWEDNAFMATWHHQRSNRDTSNRIRRSQQNRFDNGGMFQFLPFGYIKPIGAKSDLEVRKDPEEYQYDALGRLISVSLPAVIDPGTGNLVHPVYRYQYDAQGNRTAIIDPKGHTTVFEYDDYGRQVKRTLPLGFGPDGQLGTSDDGDLPDGAFAETFEYDDFGRAVRHVTFEGRVVLTAYDAQGRITERRTFGSVADADVSSPTGQVAFDDVVYTYDEFVRGVQVETWKFNASGVATQHQTTAQSFDAQGRLTSASSSQPGAQATGVINYQYDALGRLIRTYTGDADHPTDDYRYTYDALGRLATVTVWAQNGKTFDPAQRAVTRYGYDLAGNINRITLPNGITAVTQFDALGRLTKLTHYKPNSTQKLDEYQYTLRADGRWIQVDEQMWVNLDAPQTTHISYQYDADDRLVEEDHDGPTDDEEFTATYVLDLTGNRLAKRVDQGRNGTIDQTTSSTYDANDRLLTESSNNQYTVYGYNRTEQVSKVVYGDPSLALGSRISSLAFTYNLEGHLATATTTTYSNGSASRIERVSYAYDDNGIRIAAISAIDANADGTPESETRTEYLIDRQNFTGYPQTISETTTDLNVGAITKTVNYTFGFDAISQTTLIPQPDATFARTTAVFGHDGHENVRVLTDAAGAILTLAGVPQIFRYDANGVLINMPASSAGTNLLASGDEVDPFTGLGYRDARWLQFATGRFTTLDPPHASDPRNPLGYNTYLFANADAVNGSDPNGYFTVSTSIASLGLAAAFTYTSASAAQSTLAGIDHFGKFLNTVQIDPFAATLHAVLAGVNGYFAYQDFQLIALLASIAGSGGTGAGSLGGAAIAIAASAGSIELEHALIRQLLKSLAYPVLGLPIAMLSQAWDFTDANWDSGAVHGNSNWEWQQPASGHESPVLDQLPDFWDDPGNTYGKFLAPDKESAWLKSQAEGPAKDFFSKLGPAYSTVARHVEAHAFAIMRKLGIKKGMVYINNPLHDGPCYDQCQTLLPALMDESEELTVVFPTRNGGMGWGTLTKDGWKEVFKD